MGRFGTLGKFFVPLGKSFGLGQARMSLGPENIWQGFFFWFHAFSPILYTKPGAYPQECLPWFSFQFFIHAYFPSFQTKIYELSFHWSDFRPLFVFTPVGIQMF